mgnify:CR=1 FL=1
MIACISLAVGNFGALLSDTTHYTFARLDQTTTSINTRLNFTATPNLSFQFYGAPYTSSGTYTNLREIANARPGPTPAEGLSKCTGSALPNHLNPRFVSELFHVLASLVSNARPVSGAWPARSMPVPSTR